MADPVDCALDLMRRLPPQKVEENLANLVELVPHLTEDLLSAVDQPLKPRRCKATGKDYLLCDYNRDGDSYRSPWSNAYEPPLADGAQPSAKLRKLEVATNDAFNTYRELYFDGGVSSVYMWDLDEGFAAVVLIKNVSESDPAQKGSWDSIHVIEVAERSSRAAHYKLTSTVMLYMETGGAKLGNVNLSGSLTRQAEFDNPLEDFGSHVGNLGRIVEDMELKLRNALQVIYFGKTKDITNDLRSVNPLGDARRQAAIQSELIGKLVARNQ
ncbi:F-actin-capping protein subunit beta [Fimicolochytrium jonesii]|uniref:F-actin-capping protein subunit beta n=1 Tax=Fimicolochytrium jonesii TaxID=1396493 RepID=UPI0022FED696|nr:F-actin-capping protein subunit beta [Fimicolochytrium jonesii]KAI8816984.1 F-actin-capping protein subunit beta [Fimicolochytrium jonesii]